MKQKLIEKIWEYCRLTHNDQDYKDLFTFEVGELNEILTDLEQSNK